MLIYLLRHGLTEYNAQKRYQGQRDIPLSEEGCRELRRADIDPKVVYISGVGRLGAFAGGRAGVCMVSPGRCQAVWRYDR